MEGFNPFLLPAPPDMGKQPWVATGPREGQLWIKDIPRKHHCSTRGGCSTWGGSTTITGSKVTGWKKITREISGTEREKESISLLLVTIFFRSSLFLTSFVYDVSQNPSVERFPSSSLRTPFTAVSENRSDISNIVIISNEILLPGCHILLLWCICHLKYISKLN